ALAADRRPAESQALTVAEAVEIQSPYVAGAGRDRCASGRKLAPGQGQLDGVRAAGTHGGGALGLAAPVLVAEDASGWAARERRHVVVPVSVEHGAPGIDLDFVVVAIVAGIAGLKHDFHGRA